MCVSELTIAEITRTPDEELRQGMRDAVSTFPVIPLDDAVQALASEYVARGAIPANREEDAYHVAVAVAVLGNVACLASWNFKHLVREKTRGIVNTVNALRDLPQVRILTPAELL